MKRPCWIKHFMNLFVCLRTTRQNTVYLASIVIKELTRQKAPIGLVRHQCLVVYPDTSILASYANFYSTSRK